MLPPAGWAESPFDSSKARSFCPGTNEKLTVRQELTEKRRGVRLAGKVSESESTETEEETKTETADKESETETEETESKDAEAEASESTGAE